MFERAVNRRVVPALAAAVALAVGIYHASAFMAEGEPAQRLAGRAVGETPLADDLRDLCDTIGGRITGSPACERAIDWAASRFRDASVSSVSTEEFTVPSLWIPVKAEAAALDPEPFPLRVVAAPASPPTPSGAPLDAPLVDAGRGAPEEFEALGEDALGTIALVRSEEMKSFGDLFAEYMRNGPMLEAARKAGVVGLLIESTRPRGLLYRHPVTFNGKPAPLPVAMVSREHAARLGRLLEKGPVRMSLTLSIRTGPAFSSRNVVADIRGSEKPEEIVLLGAHLDSWDLGTGALDNGVNCALLIDVARGIVELGLVPRRTIRFVLFTGEEQGFWGAAGYVGRHAGELDDHVMVAIFDIGSGRISGFYLNGREELRRPVDEALWAAASLGPFDHKAGAVDGTDNFDFLLSGVPNLIADQDPAPYLPDYHAESDVYERVDLRTARNNAAIASVLAWEIAQRSGRPAPRQTREEVEKLLRSSGIDSIMKVFGQWDDWIAGNRGRHGGGS